MSFYDGKKIEVHTVCKNCRSKIVWAYLFPLNERYRGHTEMYLVIEENVSSAEVNILQERENEIDVRVSFNCRLCDYLHEFTGTIYKENGKLQFRE